jgi:diguanylate cyclase (GGDEF)-like protein/PAS domain S-box-containing protein
MTASGKELMRLLDEVSEGVYFTDRKRRITFWNKAAERISGFSGKEVIGRGCADNILIHVDDHGHSMCRGLCPLAHTLRDGAKRQADIYLHHKDGHRVPVQVRTFPLRDANRREIGAVELFSDSSEKLDLGTRLQELEKLAMVDRLTSVANRYFSEKSLEARLEEFKRFAWPLGIIFYDIDDFKAVNDQYSHRVGDRALKTVARTLQSNVRSIDQVGRWGGEEFVVILRNTDMKSLKRIAEKLRLLVERSVFWVKGEAIRVTLSGGATLARPGDTVTGLVERADLLMYKAKKAGKNRVVNS